MNFGRGSLEEAIVEAKDVAGVLGPRLLAIELGNEVENYGSGTAPLRTPPYRYETYHAEYTRWHAALVGAVPGLRFAAPDTAASVEWVERMAADAHGKVQLLTTHYYRGDQRRGTREQLMTPDTGLAEELVRLRRASEASRLPWRMCEANSFYGGGRPGVSDTLAGALWTLDFMLLLAQAGCAGVNLETGVNQLGFVSSYSPVQDNGAGHNTAGVPYYGILAFRAATEGAPEIAPVDGLEAGLGVTAYALGKGQQPRRLVVVNKTEDRTVRVMINGLGFQGARVSRLQGRELGSNAGVTFAGASVGVDGQWRAVRGEIADAEEVVLQPASAVVISNERV